jgi:hypothetical protein
MAGAPYNDKERDAQNIAFQKMIGRLSPPELEACEKAARVLSDTSGRWQDSLD